MIALTRLFAAFGVASAAYFLFDAGRRYGRMEGWGDAVSELFPEFDGDDLIPDLDLGIPDLGIPKVAAVPVRCDVCNHGFEYAGAPLGRIKCPNCHQTFEP